MVCAQSTSNEGRDFYTVFPSHVNAPDKNAQGNIISLNLAKYSVFITGKQNSSGKITVGSLIIPFTVTANNITEIDIPRSAAYIDITEANQVLTGRGIHIQVDDGKPKVVAYAHIFAGRRSAASLILPKEAMGQQYFSMNFWGTTPPDGGTNFIIVTATEDNTRFFLRKNGVDLIAGGILLPKAGDLYEYTSGIDPTGVEILVDPATSGCKRFAVFSGATNAVINRPGCVPQPFSSDPLFQQNYPVQSWGKTYGFVPFSTNGGSERVNGSYYRILAKENNTTVLVNGVLVATLNAGAFYQPPAPTLQPALISADKPIAVCQVALSQDCSGAQPVPNAVSLSDPDMVILNPVEYNIKNITVYSSSKENIAEQYINVLIKTTAASSFRINGAPAGPFVVLPNSEYSYLQHRLDAGSGTFVLSASEGFNAIAYGFGAHESYAYSAGTSLASANAVTAVQKSTHKEIDNACTKEDFDFKLTLPEIALRLTWYFADDPMIVQDNPTYKTVVKDGKTLYEYYYPKTSVFQTPGERSIKILVLYRETTCYTDEQEIDYTFEVYTPSEAKFSVSQKTCLLTPIEFTDESIENGAGRPISGWMWDFGDGTYSTEKNPKHTYAATGSYTVLLSVDNSTGCSSNVFSKTIEVNPIPVASFTSSLGTCKSNTITFTSTSTIPKGTLVKWIWDFDDGTPLLEQSTGDPVDHTYAEVGSYNASLTVVSGFGCETTSPKAVVKAFMPSLNAGADKFILRGGQTTLAIIAKGNNLQYKWTPATGLSADNVMNPVAEPAENTLYTVKITTDEGCVLSDQVMVTVMESFNVNNTFTPNGDGINDTWKIEYLDSYREAVITIYNRFGEQVFSSVGYDVPWDGTHRGVPVPMGTYYYLITPGHGLKVRSGYVTVIR